MEKENGEVTGIYSFLIVLWPAIFWVFGFLAAQVARLNGCKVWAKGPVECIFLGSDIGELVYP